MFSRPVRYMLFSLLLLAFTEGNGQERSVHRELKWGEPDAARKTEERLFFQGAVYPSSYRTFPVYQELIPLSEGVEQVTVQLSSVKAAALSDREQQIVGDAKNIPDSLLRPSVRVRYQRKAPFALVEFVPLQKAGGKLQKLLSFDIELKGERSVESRGQRSQHQYAQNSVLESGQWYKVGVTESGVHRLTYEQLETLGIALDSITTADINIFGNGQGLLPFKNDVPRPDDLRKNAIRIEGGRDGRFDPGDELIFYAKGPHVWEYDPSAQSFAHQYHLYSDTAYYFIGIGVGSPERVTDMPSVTSTPTHTVTTFIDRQFHEQQSVNLLKSGRRWFGQPFGTVLTRELFFSFPNIDKTASAKLKMRVMARTLGTGNSSSFDTRVNGQNTGSFSVGGVTDNYLSVQARAATHETSFLPDASGLNLSVTFNEHAGSSEAWIDYVELIARRQLKMAGDQMTFRDTGSVGGGNIAEFRLSNASGVERVWDITDPTHARRVPISQQGNDLTFKVAADSLREFVAFTGDVYKEPSLIGKVENQDLHGLSTPDLTIICHPRFWEQAGELAELHREEGLTVEMVTPQQVYNEFSSGMPDITAIKSFMKMFYDRAGSDPDLLPDHLLLFGDGSFINHDRSNTDNTNFIPTYQSANSRAPIQSYVSDDYFGLLDDDEGEALDDLVDIGIGRLPVATKGEARSMVRKIRQYIKGNKLHTEEGCSASDQAGVVEKGWRNLITFVSDDQSGDGFEGVIHMSQADQLATQVRNAQKAFDIDKIYLDAYQQQSTPGGERYPEAEEDLQKRVEKGTLIMNYTGHGGENGWAHERVLGSTTIKQWENFPQLPLFMTATCEFSRFDDPDRTSAGENVILNRDGGGIALLTTTRVVYSTPNYTLNSNFYDHLFERKGGEYIRLGEVTRRTKNSSTVGSSNNHRNFTLLGDPALRLAIPDKKVVAQTLNADPVGGGDTIKALSKVTITGEVQDENGKKLSDFDGIVYPKVFDKRKEIQTLANDGGNPFEFDLFKNKLFKGKASVKNGEFDFTFVVPKDIAYQFGNGRVSFYAVSEENDANGYTEDVIVGGAAEGVAADNAGPDIDLYMNDSTFVPGGMTDESPVLLAHVFDENGVNTVGSGIGHDITAVVDGNTSDKKVLNDHYESDLDTYKSGKVRYQLSELKEGGHTVDLKVWDVYNNSAEETLDFVVANSEELALDHILNYPNPFTTHTEFWFEHNQVCSFLDVRIQVFTVSGKLVKSFNRRVKTDGFRIDPIEWNGRDDFGDPLGRGVYVYKLSVQTPEGQKVEKFEKLVILN